MTQRKNVRTTIDKIEYWMWLTIAQISEDMKFYAIR